jgi:hypothetical protein
MRCDAIRRPERFVQMLDACEADKSSRRAVGPPESAGEPFTARADAMAALDRDNGGCSRSDRRAAGGSGKAGTHCGGGS